MGWKILYCKFPTYVCYRYQLKYKLDNATQVLKNTLRMLAVLHAKLRSPRGSVNLLVIVHSKKIVCEEKMDLHIQC